MKTGDSQYCMMLNSASVANQQFSRFLEFTIDEANDVLTVRQVGCIDRQSTSSVSLNGLIHVQSSRQVKNLQLEVALHCLRLQCEGRIGNGIRVNQQSLSCSHLFACVLVHIQEQVRSEDSTTVCGSVNRTVV